MTFHENDQNVYRKWHIKACPKIDINGINGCTPALQDLFVSIQMFLVNFFVTFFHVVFDVACFWIKKCMALFVREGRPVLNDLYALLNKAESYVEWSAIALRID